MRRRPASAFLSLGLLALVLLSYVACAQQGAMTGAMRQQEAEMNDESSSWNDALARWRSEHEEIRAWHAHRDTAGATSTPLPEVTAHEREVAEFQAALDHHRTGLEEAGTRSEAQRAGSHPERWSEHARLEARFRTLSRTHQRLVAAHHARAGREPASSALLP